jgi:hypothetical protein
MSNDAKLALVLGVAIVLLIALVFFRNDALEARMSTDPTKTTTVSRGLLATPFLP